MHRVRYSTRRWHNVEQLTLALHAMSINGGAANHDIVDDREAAFTADPIALAVLDAAVGQHNCLVELHASIMELFSEGDFIGMEKIPNGPIQNLFGGVSKYVDDGVG